MLVDDDIDEVGKIHLECVLLNDEAEVEVEVVIDVDVVVLDYNDIDEQTDLIIVQVMLVILDDEVDDLDELDVDELVAVIDELEVYDYVLISLE